MQAAIKSNFQIEVLLPNTKLLLTREHLVLLGHLPLCSSSILEFFASSYLDGRKCKEDT